MECGNCTLCCELLPIVELNKPESTLCGYCTSNKGCNIYNTRPQSCIDFKCLYNLSDEMDIELRPDNTDVIFEKITEDIYLGLVNPKNLIAWKSKVVQDYIDTLYNRGISVVISSFTQDTKKYKIAKNHTPKYVIDNIVKELNK